MKSQLFWVTNVEWLPLDSSEEIIREYKLFNIKEEFQLGVIKSMNGSVQVTN